MATVSPLLLQIKCCCPCYCCCYQLLLTLFFHSSVVICCSSHLTATVPNAIDPAQQCHCYHLCSAVVTLLFCYHPQLIALKYFCSSCFVLLPVLCQCHCYCCLLLLALPINYCSFKRILVCWVTALLLMLPCHCCCTTMPFQLHSICIAMILLPSYSLAACTVLFTLLLVIVIAFIYLAFIVVIIVLSAQSTMHESYNGSGGSSCLVDGWRNWFNKNVQRRQSRILLSFCVSPTKCILPRSVYNPGYKKVST